MARTIKEGLDYYSLDTNLFGERKIRRLLKTFGPKGFTIFICLLCEIYKDKGYHILWTNELAFDISDNVPDTTEQLVRDVVSFCAECGLFDKSMFSVKAIITSTGIQKRYKKAKEGSKVVINTEIWVINRKTHISNITIPIVLPESTQSKVEERKEELPAIVSSGSVLQSIDQLKTDCLNDPINFVEYVCRQNKISQIELTNALNTFNSHLKSGGEVVKSTKDYRFHFQNWLRKQDLKSLSIKPSE